MPAELNLYPPDAPALLDGPIRFALSLRNTNGTAIEVPDPKRYPKFSYRVFSGDDSKLLCTASIAGKAASVPRLAALPVIPVPSISLAPGAVVNYQDDLTSLLVQPLPPGRYFVEATYRDKDVAATSGRVPLEVVLSRPISLAQTLDGKREKVVIVEFHRREDGAVLIRKRSSDATLLDRFYDLHTFKPAIQVEETAIALEAGFGIPANWRWIAWLDGSALYAGVARIGDFQYPNGPIDLGLESPHLLPYGYLHRDGGGTFVVTGLANGQPKFRLVTIPAGKDAAASVADVQLANLPDSIPSATMVCRENGSRELVLSWTRQAPGMESVVQVRIDSATGAVLSGPDTILQTPRTIAASHAAPLINPGQFDAFQALLAPQEEGGRHTLTAIEFSGAAERREFDLPSLDVLEGRPIESWILSSNYVPGAGVALATKGEIWFTDTTGDWRKVGDGEAAVSSIRLWTFDARTTACSWFDPVHGYRSVRL